MVAPVNSRVSIPDGRGGREDAVVVHVREDGGATGPRYTYTVRRLRDGAFLDASDIRLEAVPFDWAGVAVFVGVLGAILTFGRRI